MVRALVWKDKKSFQQHVEIMIGFRKSHQNNVKSGLPRLQDMPAQGHTITRDEPGDTVGNIGPEVIFVSIPIGEIILARNSQN